MVKSAMSAGDCLPTRCGIPRETALRLSVAVFTFHIAVAHSRYLLVHTCRILRRLVSLSQSATGQFGQVGFNGLRVDEHNQVH